MKKFYFATSEEGLKRFQRSGFLLPDIEYFMRHKIRDDSLLLYSSPEEARKHGLFLIEIEYNPMELSWSNNWKDGADAHREYMPIPSKFCKVLK